jgi:hypothetical protein
LGYSRLKQVTLRFEKKLSMMTSALLALVLAASESKTVKTSDGTASVRLVLAPAPKSGYTRILSTQYPGISFTAWRGTRVWGLEGVGRNHETGKWERLDIPRAEDTRISVFELRSRGRKISVPAKLYQSLFVPHLSTLKLTRERDKLVVSFSGSDGGGSYDAKVIVRRATIERQAGREGVAETIVVKQRNRL